ncbi:WhiB family transcriptional regulator [Kitasatospora terrestris]|uniref:Transcriptional regulator WhiB n=1 Tax=Kitasatospora terrestris TaxID=258051 RepID=A0ABP9DKS2_9ACTN
MARIVRRAHRGVFPEFPKGTRIPHRTARPTGSYAVEVVPSPDGDLHGAACAGVNPDLFFPEVEPEDADDPVAAEAAEFASRRAKAICATCPVREACLALALRRRERYGIFGGLDAAERRALKRSGAASAEVA